VRFDLVIRGGEVFDPDSTRVEAADIAVSHGRIAAVDREIPVSSAFRSIDASGLLVTPGWIDLHSHVYRGVTYWGVDAGRLGALTGVTTFVDAGSAGALTFGGFREFIVDPSPVRIYAFLNIAYIGLVAPDYELANLAYCDRDIFGRIASENRDIIVGTKVRMTTPTIGDNGLEPLRIAIGAASENDLPVMVHIGPAPPTGADLLPLMRPGDVLTHCFTGHSARIVGEDGRILEVARRAWDAGVVMDIGHGSGSFSFATAEGLAHDGLWPDVISTDVHQESINGPMFDLPTCVSKFLALGMPLERALYSVTKRPAEVIGRQGELGTLRKGAPADLAVFRRQSGEFRFYDITGSLRVGSEYLENVMTLVNGRSLPRLPLREPAPWMERGRIWPAASAALREKQFALADGGGDPRRWFPGKSAASNGGSSSSRDLVEGTASTANRQT